MKQKTLQFLAILIAGISLIGCSSKDGSYATSPLDTVTTTAHNNRADWVNQADIYYSEGLEPRKMRGSTEFQNAIASGSDASVYFDFDSSAISPGERSKLGQIAQKLKMNAGVKILIEGHCDWRGTTEYNLALGERRANSVKTYLSQLGVNPNQIETLSKGSLNASTGLTKNESYKDRRSDLYKI